MLYLLSDITIHLFKLIYVFVIVSRDTNSNLMTHRITQLVQQMSNKTYCFR